MSMERTSMSHGAYTRLIQQREHLTQSALPEARQRVDDLQNGGADNEGLEAVQAVFDAEQIAGELARLDRLIASADIVDPAGRDSVGVGSIVVLDFGDGPEEYVFDTVTGTQTVGPESPLGGAIEGRRAGDQVEVRSPGGAYVVRILDIR